MFSSGQLWANDDDDESKNEYTLVLRPLVASMYLPFSNNLTDQCISSFAVVTLLFTSILINTT